MKNRFIVIIAIMIGFVFSAQAQEEKENDKITGTMMASTTKTFTFTKDGTTFPYKVTVHENRNYTASFDDADKGKIDQDRLSTAAKVAKLITVYNEQEPTYNRLIVLRYDKQVTDTFELVSMQNGFAVKVDDKSVNYILGEGLYFTNTNDKDFFAVDIFDYMF
ncbi:hypothetical protein ACOKFD_01040 [Flagellimonas sp. S174]|uniref:hypothetical protein n=1 Tax=Flagellimonas sp. S174 TaxID=3410790 RepID=UPI003BF4C0F0